MSGSSHDPRPTTNDPVFRSGFVAVVGRPNVGKSTLFNRLIGHKVSIVTPVPQTTRVRAQGVITLPSAQLLLIDTPAFHHPRDRLGTRMLEEARAALADADVVVWVIDMSAPPTGDDAMVASALRESGAPIVLAQNKMDRLRNAAAAAPDLSGIPVPAAIVPVAAATGAGCEHLRQTLLELLPAGPLYFPADMFTDQPEQNLVREYVREQAMLLTREEVPHGIAVELEEFAPREGQDLIYVRAVIFVERDAHRKILIGAGGRMLREIGRRARRHIEALLGSRVYLDLWVKVAKDWRTKDAMVRRFYPT